MSSPKVNTTGWFSIILNEPSDNLIEEACHLGLRTEVVFEELTNSI
jgi:hypothetical protein